MDQFHPPVPVLNALQALHMAGYQAWAVGGCVRDSLLGRMPHDWDITTSALPQQTMAVFKGCRLLQTGLRHGTVTLLLEDQAIEITTYRVDGIYSDGRRPDQVTFTPNLQEDLARRDLTINAIAWNPWQGLFDPFNGQQDLRRRSICCVGDPKSRFDEDALRVIRAIRFSAQLDFSIEAHTAQAVHRCASNLKLVAPERFWPELQQLCTGPKTVSVLLEYGDVIGKLLPELAPMLNHPQYNYHHIYDIWEHTVRAMGHVPPLPRLRVALLLHDSGKPACFTRDEQGVGHFYGHGEVSYQIAKKVLLRMACPGELRRQIFNLVRWHDALVPLDRIKIRRWMARIGSQGMLDLAAIKRADNLAQAPQFYRIAENDRLEALCRQIIEEGDCFSLKQLAVNGRDLMALGFQGEQIGLTLDRLLNDVIDGRLPNQREKLLKSAAARAEKLLNS